MLEARVTRRGRDLAHAIVEDYPDNQRADILRACSLIARHARTHKHLAEAQCNGFQDWRGNWDQAQADAAEKRSDAIEARILTLVQTWIDPYASAIFGGDPRGATVKIVLPSGRTNDFGREGIIADVD